MGTTAERLRRFKSSTPSRWKEKIEARLANQEERRNARKVALQMLDAMEQKGLTEVALAEILGVSGAELSSVLKGHKLPSAVMRKSIVSVLEITSHTN